MSTACTLKPVRTNLVELHGSIRRMRCSSDSCSFCQTIGPSIELPQCPQCTCFSTPDVVWFGEMLPANNLEIAIQASRACDVFFSVGTSGVVEPAASLPYEALRSGAVVLEVNPQPTPLSIHARYYFSQPAGQILPILSPPSWGN
jgi:NAD-dependent deacetylase